MPSQDLRLLRGIITELSHHLNQHIEEDETFFIQLQQFPFYRKIKGIPPYCRKIHATIKTDLEKAYALCAEKEKSAKGISEARTINKVEPLINSFHRNLGREWDFLQKVLHDSEVEENAALVAVIKQRAVSENKMHHNERMRQINQFLSKTYAQIRPQFKLKRGLLSLRRPKISEEIKIGNTIVYLDIFFDHNVSDKLIAQLLQSYTTTLLEDVNKELQQRISAYPAWIKANITKQVQFIQEHNIKFD